MIISICLIVFMIGGGIWCRQLEKKEWNDGICRETGKPWVRFDTNSQGGRGYRSGDHFTWISYGVDSDYDHHRARFTTEFTENTDAKA